MKISTIVITGGPCAGKTTALSWIENTFTQLGYTVLFIPETATELINGGVSPWTCGSNEAFQKCQMRLQLEKEKVFHDAALSMSADKILIVCDRGAMDNRAYMTDDEFASVLCHVASNEIELRDGYDAVFHLVTAANGAEEFYTTANNTARTEPPEEAIVLDNKLIAAWTGHPHLRVIGNETGFEDKMKALIKEISVFLGEPEPLEIERKFLIEYPDLDWLRSYPSARAVDIVQTYLTSEPGCERRVRKRGEKGNYIYLMTTKRKISGMKRIETESRLTREEYESLLTERDPERREIQKTRYCLTYEGHYFEIDIFPFWSDKALAEIELSDENEEILLPPQLKLIKEVTHDDAYKNASLAKII